MDKKRLDIISSSGHVIVLGGPGSGKTHIALLKAEAFLSARSLLPGQSVLFLSFARATIARLAEKAGGLIGAQERKQLELNTYHGFAWNTLRSHGYLLQPKARLTLLPPPEAASHLSTIAKGNRDAEKERLFVEDGILHFDLFARKTALLLQRSARLRRIISNAYPIIVLDEFQDTNPDEWALIQALGINSHLVALADANQRIYEFRGADPKRISEFIASYKPSTFDFGNENNRSNGRDIAQFGNDLLSGANRGRVYNDVEVCRYGFYQGLKVTYSMKTALLKAIQRCVKQKLENWSVAVLVPSKKLMLAVSSYLESELDNLPSIPHDVALDTAGPALAASLIAFILESEGTGEARLNDFLRRLCQHIYGRKGDNPATANERKLVDALREYTSTGKIRGSKRLGLIESAKLLLQGRASLGMSGDPGEDWLATRQLFANAACGELCDVAQDAKYLRLLHKGASLRSRLAELWRNSASYAGAEFEVKDALLQEHFSLPTRPTRGIYVMTIHKSKGKEFTEVLLYEDAFQGRYLRMNATPNEIAQSRLTLRVGVTRSECRTTILTPQRDGCPLL